MFYSVLFYENIEVCAKAHGQIWSGQTLWSAYLSRLRLSSGYHANGSAARPLRPQIKDGVVLEYIHFPGLSALPVRVAEYYHLLIIWLYEVRTCVFAILNTVRLEDGLH